MGPLVSFESLVLVVSIVLVDFLDYPVLVLPIREAGMASITEAVSSAMSTAIASSMDPNAGATKQFIETQMTTLQAQALNAQLDTMDRLERKIESLKEQEADGRTIEVYQSLLEKYSGARR